MIDIARDEGIQLSSRTLRKAFAREGYHRRHAREKPLLTDKQMEARLAWAYEHVSWTQRQWSNVVWTDEASIKVGGFGEVYVTRKPGEAFINDCLTPKFRGYSACMIWGCITPEGVNRCTVFDAGSINGDTYRTKIIPLISAAGIEHQRQALFGQAAIIMQDNAAIHTARLTRELFASLGLVLMSWPANSPDLNPIENIWAILKRRIGQHMPQSRAECMAAVELEWSRLTSADIAQCCQNMNKRCLEVIAASGGHTVR